MMTASSDESVIRDPQSAVRKPRTLRVRTLEELEHADTLRPSEIYRIKGIPAPTLHGWCAKLPTAERLPSIKIRGVKGRRGMRLVNRITLDLWLEWQGWRAEIIEPKAMEAAEFKAFAAWRQARERENALPHVGKKQLSKGLAHR